MNRIFLFAVAFFVSCVVATGCGNHTKEDTRNTKSWFPPAQVGPYEVYFHASYTAKQQTCILAGVTAHWNRWNRSFGWNRFGQNWTGKIYILGMNSTFSSPVKLGATAWTTGVGAGHMIEYKPVDHRCPGLLIEIDQHQDPYLEGFDPWYQQYQRWGICAQVDQLATFDAMVAQQPIKCHP